MSALEKYLKAKVNFMAITYIGLIGLAVWLKY